jgi:hypothetical protein
MRFDGRRVLVKSMLARLGDKTSAIRHNGAD